MSQTTTKFIADNAVIGTKIRLNNAEDLRARNQANSADVALLRLNTSNQLELQTQPYAAAALAIPSQPKQYATVEYIQNYLEGKSDVKNAANYLAVGNIAGTFDAGNGTTTAASITGNTQLTVDGKSFTSADVSATYPIRIGLIGQTSAFQNGIYDLTAASGSSYTLTRSFDFDGLNNASGYEVTSGAWFRVIAGTVYTGYEVQLTTADPIVLNTTNLTFASYPSAINYVGGDMISITGNTITVDLAAFSGLESTNPGNDAGQLRVKTATAAAEKDRTLKIDATGTLVVKKPFTQSFTLASGDITNQYVDLSRVAGDSSVRLHYPGAGSQIEGLDFTVNYTAGTGSNTRVTFAGGLATGGASALVTGDAIYITYEAFSS